MKHGDPRRSTEKNHEGAFLRGALWTSVVHAFRSCLVAGSALALASCATTPPAKGFIFGVMGDAPYNDREEVPYKEMLNVMSGDSLAFIVHVGDTKAGGSGRCSDAFYEMRRAQFDRVEHPILYTPGDNEWTDCRRPGAGGLDPIDRLAKIREVYFGDDRSLGAQRMETDVQAGYPENRAWTYGGVRFVTLDFPGKSNNMGHDARNDDEARSRTEANRQWLARAVEASAAASVRALVIATQANPWVAKPGIYDAFIAQVRDAAVKLGKPMLFVHGDTHMYRVDTPFVDASGQPVPGITRLETYGSPFVGWVRVTVDPDRPDLFTFEPRLQAIIPP